jgi:hypothetical protein
LRVGPFPLESFPFLLSFFLLGQAFSIVGKGPGPSPAASSGKRRGTTAQVGCVSEDLESAAIPTECRTRRVREKRTSSRVSRTWKSGRNEQESATERPRIREGERRRISESCTRKSRENDYPFSATRVYDERDTICNRSREPAKSKIRGLS